MREILSSPVDGDFVNKLDWMKDQLNNFAKQTEDYFPRGFCVIEFNDSVERHDQCDAEKLSALLKAMRPSGGTNLVGALTGAVKPVRTTPSTQGSALVSTSSASKPMALFIITDAFNVDPESEYARIVTAKNNEFANVRIVFLTIGESGSSNPYLRTLTTALQQKMKPRSVATVPFSTFLKKGLLRTVVETLK